MNYSNTHKIRIEHTDAGVITVFIDGTQVLTCTSKRFNGGFFGLYNQPNAGQSVKLTRFEYAYK